jgi:hypothetical protein
MTDEFEPGDVNGQQAATGNAVVDDVLAGLVDLGEKPVEEHVAVFEHAHEQLRGVLDGPRMPRP